MIAALILVERGKLKFLRHGGQLVVSNPGGRCRARRIYALATTAKPRAAVCRVEVTELVGTEQMKVRLADVDAPVLLARKSQYGYTSDPALAMFAEPEAVAPADLERLSRRAADRYAREHAEELAQRRARSIGTQVKEAARRYDFSAFERLGHELVSLAAGANSTTGAMAVVAGTLGATIPLSPSAGRVL